MAETKRHSRSSSFDFYYTGKGSSTCSNRTVCGVWTALTYKQVHFTRHILILTHGRGRDGACGSCQSAARRVHPGYHPSRAHTPTNEVLIGRCVQVFGRKPGNPEGKKQMSHVLSKAPLTKSLDLMYFLLLSAMVSNKFHCRTLTLD